jgi:hypothetical protein
VRTRDAAWTALLGVVVFLCYLQTSCTIVPASGDGYLEWKFLIGPAEHRPNHLELTNLFRVVSVWLGASPLHLSAVRTMAVVNALAGALGVALWFFVARRKGIRPMVAGLGALLLAFSFAYWYHAREPETAMVAEGFFLAAIALANRASSRAGAGKVWAAAASGAAFAASCLMALNLAVFVPLLAWLVAAKGGRGERVSALFAFGAAVFLVAAPPFVSEYRQASGAAAATATPIGFFTWVLHHPASDLMGSVPRGVSVLTTARALAGMGRGILLQGGDAPSQIKLWLLRRPAPAFDPISLAAFVFAGALGLLLFAITWRTAWRERRGDPFWGGLAIGTLCGLIAAVNWLGSDPQFWLPIYPLLYWSGARATDSLVKPAGRLMAITGLATLVVLFFVANLAWPVPTPTQARGGTEWRSARRFARTLQRGDLYLSLESLWSFYVVESEPRVRPVSLLIDVPGRGRAYVDRITARIDSTLAAGGTVYAEGMGAPPSLALEGEWENIEWVHSVARDSVRGTLRDRYRLELVPETGAGLGRLTRPVPEEGPAGDRKAAILPKPHQSTP